MTKRQIRPLAVVLKGLVLLLILNFLFALPWSNNLEKISIYNTIVPGNKRFRGNTDLDLHISTHLISVPKEADEFRVLFIGDSSTYGVLLHDQETVAELINAETHQTCKGKNVKVYNLASTGQSTLMDLLIMDTVFTKEPDLIVWFFTLNTFSKTKVSLSTDDLPLNLKEHNGLMINRQLAPNFILNNIETTKQIVSKYDLNIKFPKELSENEETLWDQSLIGQRFRIADWYNTQLSGIKYANQIDYSINTRRRKITPAAEIPLSNSNEYRGLTSPADNDDLVYTEVMETALQSFSDTPILLVNEPILISPQKNNDIRYNDAYPIWAYDQYRGYMRELSTKNNWNLLDIWNVVPSQYFTNSSFHRSPEGEAIVAKMLTPEILNLACQDSN